jgi:hypothetical protein
MRNLTKEELEEVAALEKEASERAAADAAAAKRQHLEALRLTKRLAPKYGEHGKDFLVFETTVGNFAIRRPVDVEVDGITEGSERADLEKFAASIVLEPPAAELQTLMAKHVSVVGVVVNQSFKLTKLLREEEAKK